MQGELALLLCGLDRHEAHVRPARSLADGWCVIGVVLAALAGHAIGRDEVACDQPGIQAHQAQATGHVVGAAAGLHRHDAALGQLGAPREEPIHRHGLGQHSAALSIDRMHLVNPLGQIHPYPRHRRTCNLRHGFPLFRFRLNFRESILVPGHRIGTGEVPSYSLVIRPKQHATHHARRA